MNFKNLTLLQAKDLLETRQITSYDLMDNLIKIAEQNSKLNFVTNYTREYMEQLMEKKPYVLPIGIKDNFHVQGLKTTCASKMMENYKAPITASLVSRLEENNMGCMFKTNMDQFAMGSTGMTSYFGATFCPYKNYKGEHFLPGGSSSGSAVAVACGAALAAIGTDTGGSIRQPAAWCGVVGFKPTYGVLSRYGIVELASSLDCPGFLTKNVDDCRFLLSVSMGKDKLDHTSVDISETFTKKKKVGVLNLHCQETNILIKEACNYLKTQSYEIIDVQIPHIEHLPEIYYTINTIESSSNLSRFNSIAYGNSDYMGYGEDHFRTHHFGDEVKRRILVGNYIKNRTHFHKYYTKAKQVLQDIWLSLNSQLQQLDGVLLPSALPAMTIEQCKKAPITDIYKQDQFTCLANLLGLPSISIPIGFFSNKSPVGLQIMGNPLDDFNVINLAGIIEKYFNFNGGIQ